MHNNKLSIDTRTHTLTQRVVRRDSCAVSVSAWAATAVAGEGTGDPGVYPLEQCGGSKHTYSEHSSVCNTAVEPGKVRLACRANNTIDTFPSVAVHTHTNTQEGLARVPHQTQHAHAQGNDIVRTLQHHIRATGKGSRGDCPRQRRPCAANQPHNATLRLWECGIRRRAAGGHRSELCQHGAR